MEENFEKKSSKNFLKVLIPVIILAIIIVGGFYIFSKINSNPEHTFKKTVEKAFSKIEVKENVNAKKSKTNMIITAELNSKDKKVQEIQEYLKNIKLKLNEESDIDKEILKFNAKVDYENDELIDANLILQNGKAYLYSKDLFNRYIDLFPNDLSSEEIKNLSGEIFEEARTLMNKISPEKTNELLKEIEKAILNYLKEKEYDKTKEEITVNGKTINATKSTLKLNEKETAQLVSEIIEVLKDNKYFTELMGEDIKSTLEEKIDELKEVEATGDTNLEISLYTKGSSVDVIKAEIKIEEYEEDILKITYLKENKEKAYVELEVEGESIKVEINKKSKNEVEYRLVLPEELQGLEIALQMKEDNDNKGTMALIIKVPKIYLSELNIEDDVELKLNIDYETNYDITVEEEKVGNAVNINELTERDEEELRTNLKKSKLYEVISSFTK